MLSHPRELATAPATVRPDVARSAAGERVRVSNHMPRMTSQGHVAQRFAVLGARRRVSPPRRFGPFLLMARSVLLTLAPLIAATYAYLHPSNPISARTDARMQRAVTPLKMAYVPDGLTPEQWKALKKKEEEERKKKNFGAGGTRGFKSRSMWSFIEAYEKGEAQHLYPVDPSKVKTGEIPLKDVPYSAFMAPLCFFF